MSRGRARRLLSAALVLHVGLAALAATTPMRHGDFDRFWELGSAAGRPYVGYEAEYPPGTLLAFRVAVRVAADRRRFGWTMIAFNLAADLIVVAALAWGWGVVAAAFFAVTVVPILKMLFFRADLWSAALTTIAIAAWRRQRDTMVGLLLPVAGALKLWPLPIGLALCWPYGRRRVGVAIARALFIVLTAVLLLYWWSLDGWAGFHQVLTFRNAHGWHDESTVGAVLYFLHPNAHRQEEGASRVGSITGLVSIALMLVAAVFTVAAVWRSARDRRIGTGWVAGIGAMLVCSALFSPQFLVWLLPGAAVAWAEEEKLAPALVAFAVLVTGINRIGDERAWLFLVRNVIVVASTFAASGVLWRQTALTRLASKIQPHAIPQT